MSCLRTTILHPSLDVRGVLRWGKRDLRRACKWIRRPGGGEFTPDELRDALLDELAKGNEFVPFGDCDDFDPKSGCRGHERPTEPDCCPPDCPRCAQQRSAPEP